MGHLFISHYRSPIGILEIAGSDRGIRSIRFVEEFIPSADEEAHLSLGQCLEQLSEYFNGHRKAFDSLRLAASGTDFQHAVWDAAMAIPFGETRTYGDIAEAIGEAAAARAVGNALNANPLLIIVPCHRVIPASAHGDESGEYAGGRERKAWLLAHERRHS
jgi:methylated-DNA-[protein]-cysteine S-methyltransferase